MGIAAALGDDLLYARLLEMFKDREADFPRRFIQALDAGDRTVATRMAHDLKCVAGTLGIVGVHRAAGELERACIDEADGATLENLVAVVGEMLAPVISELQSTQDDSRQSA